jgi:transposase
MPLEVELTPGQQHESTRCEPLIQKVLDEPFVLAPDKLAGDKGYSASRIRKFLQELGIEDVIARRKDERKPGDEDAFDRESYRRRNIIERCIGWLKQCRAAATRYDKLATNFLGTLRLAIIRLLLRRLESG